MLEGSRRRGGGGPGSWGGGSGQGGVATIQNTDFEETLPREAFRGQGGPGRMEAAFLHMGHPRRIQATPAACTAFLCINLSDPFLDTFPLKMDRPSDRSPDSRGSPACPATPPLPGLYEHRGHAGRGVQDLVDLHLRPAVHPVPLPRVPRRQVVHHRELVVAAALGTEPDLVPMVLDLRLMPQCCLNLRGRGGGNQTKAMCSKVSGGPGPESILGRPFCHLLYPPHGCPRLQGGPEGVRRATTPTLGVGDLPWPAGCNPKLAQCVRGETRYQPPKLAKVTQIWEIDHGTLTIPRALTARYSTP